MVHIVLKFKKSLMTRLQILGFRIRCYGQNQSEEVAEL